MVQGSKNAPQVHIVDRDLEARKAGFEALQKQEQARKDAAKKEKDSKYGSWGPVYKNRQNFVDMHLC
uniref:Uncharacterized protein n=2 Tax=Timema TaxID=61471 RepID=A0A7R9B3R5_TIMSH|nr:unnamed protein product [Timema shepardi]CAD7575172.1 unnamed protein product [Timema californicum]